MEMSNMAYLNETSSVKTIVTGAEVSGFCDVVARQKINEVSGEVPQLSAGEGIGISTVDGKTVITNNISAGQNISLVYDIETNTYRIDASSHDISAYTLTGSDGIGVSTDHVNRQTVVTYTGTMGDQAVNNVVRSYSAAGTWLTSHQSLSNYYKKTETSSKQEISAALDYVSANAGKTYNGVAPIQVNNSTNEISITGESISAGPGIDMFSSGGYVVISSNAGNTFPITGTNGTTGFTANMDCSSMYISTGVNTQGSVVNFNTKGVHYAAYPSTDVSASWYDIITQLNNITCSSVKLTTSYREKRFVTSSLPNLNKITFIAPSYGPYGTYSAKIDDGENTFVAEVASGCCMTVVKCWNEDRNKDCWCGLNQETYSYIG